MRATAAAAIDPDAMRALVEKKKRVISYDRMGVAIDS